jgi:hypothetical protein
MQLKLKQIIENVIDFQLLNKKLCYQDTHSQLHVQDFDFKQAFVDAYYLSRNWYFSDGSLYKLKLDKSFERITNHKTIHAIDEQNKMLLLCSDLKLDAQNEIVGTLSLFNLKKRAEIPNTAFPLGKVSQPILCKTDLYFVSDRHVITAYDIITQKTLWAFDTYRLSKDGLWVDPITHDKGGHTIISLIRVIDKILWLNVKGGILLGIDVQTGKPVHCLKTVTKMNAAEDNYPYWHLPLYDSYLVSYDEKANKLFSISTCHYWEADLTEKQPQIRMWLLQAEFKKHEMDYQGGKPYVVTDSHIYFIDTHYPRLGALNRQTLQLQWVCHLSKEFPELTMLVKLEVLGKKIYLRDLQNKLFIFEMQ